jgi:hypothetical protein
MTLNEPGKAYLIWTIFVSKETTQTEHLKLSLKGLPRTNALAYVSKASLKKRKVLEHLKSASLR